MEAAEFGTFFEPQRLRMNELRLLLGRIAERVAGSHFSSVFPILPSALKRERLEDGPALYKVCERE